MPLSKVEMKDIINKATAECKDCNWQGTKYKVLIAMDGYHCPKCNSKEIVILKEAKLKTA